MQIYDIAIEYDDEKKVYPASLQYRPDFESYFQRLLKRAHDQKLPIWCLCPGAGEKRLAVRWMASINKHYLARYPNTRIEHDMSCQFATETPSVRAAQSTGAAPTPAHESDAPVAPVFAPPRWDVCVADTALGELSLADVLSVWWREAGMNIWNPAFYGKRNVGLVMHYLRKAGDTLLVNGNALSTHTLFAAQSQKSSAYHANVELVEQALDSGAALFVVAPLATFQAQKHESPKFLPISNFHGIPRLRIEPQEWDEGIEQNLMAFDLWRQGINAVALIALEPMIGGDVAEVRQFGLMCVTNQWVPVSNWREFLLANKLVSEQRHFLRPMSRQPKVQRHGPAFYLTDRQQKIALHIGSILTRSEDENPRFPLKHENESSAVRQVEWVWNGMESSSIPDFP